MQQDSVRKTYQDKLMRTPQHEQALEPVVLRCRTLYTCAVEQRRTWWGRGQGIGATYSQQATELPDLKAAYPDYAEVHSPVLQDVLRRVDTTYHAFFRRVAHGQTPGYPRVQGANRSHCFPYPQYGNGAVLDGGMLSLAKIGQIPVRLHRPLAGTPKTVTISREADGWYVCRSCADVPVQPLPPTGADTGIDVGLKVVLITADGEGVDNPRQYRKAQRRLAKAQRRVARRNKGSYRRRKAITLLKRPHQQVQRRDLHHKTALRLLRQYDVIHLEDVRVANMVRNHHLATSISDASWAQFRTILEGTAADAGRRVVAVSPAYTSQECSGGGERVRTSLSMRTHSCPVCGVVLDRDVNAARNMLASGRAGPSGANVVRWDERRLRSPRL